MVSLRSRHIPSGLPGTYAGLRATLVVAGVMIALASLWLVLSPLRTMRDIPEPAVAD